VYLTIFHSDEKAATEAFVGMAYVNTLILDKDNVYIEMLCDIKSENYRDGDISASENQA
jgi:hypothetical protein